MKIDLKDYETVYTADADYDGPEGTMIKGTQFRVVEPKPIGRNLFAAMIIGDDYPMSFRHNEGTLVSD